MAWIYLESLVALVALVGIVWWTMKPARKRDASETDDREP
jgi:hypothetical protein